MQSHLRPGLQSSLKGENNIRAKLIASVNFLLRDHLVNQHASQSKPSSAYSSSSLEWVVASFAVSDNLACSYLQDMSHEKHIILSTVRCSFQERYRKTEQSRGRQFTSPMSMLTLGHAVIEWNGGQNGPYIF